MAKVKGPLFSVAERLGSSITVVPHSSYPTQPLPHAVNVTAIERDGFAQSVNLKLAPLSTSVFRWSAG